MNNTHWLVIIRNIIGGLFRLAAAVLTGIGHIAITIAVLIEPKQQKEETNGATTKGTGNPSGDGIYQN